MLNIDCEEEGPVNAKELCSPVEKIRIVETNKAHFEINRNA
ncbi:hypothetical protein [Echinicola marina]|nr:hypothetical protein [Echinicola marina]